MVNIYFDPKIDYKIQASLNPYIFHLENTLSKKYNIVNKNYNKIGVIDFFKYIFKADLYLFNWIEDLPSRRYGKLQIITFVLFLYCAKFFGKKIGWTLHNKYSHDITKNKWTDFMYNFLIKNSDLILTHSKNGIEFIIENYSLYSSKIIHIPLPIQEILPASPNEEQTFDFLIWGTIFPYKGILPFLEFISESQLGSKFKILIVGRCFDKEYKKEINKYLSKNIVHYDKFYELEEISNFSKKSKFILFTYKPDEVLSSSSLMDSIRMRSIIIGPNQGAFKDLSSYSFVKTYDNYEEIIEIYNNYTFNKISVCKEIEYFCKENSWDLFVEKLDIELVKIL